MKMLPVQGAATAGVSGFGQTDKAKEGFAERLKAAIEDVNDSQLTSQQAVQDVVTGKMDVQDGMIALAKADISLRMMLAVRDKAINAYQQIMGLSF